MIIECITTKKTDVKFGEKYIVTLMVLKILNSDESGSWPGGMCYIYGPRCVKDTMISITDCKIIDGRIPSNWSCPQYGDTPLEFTLAPSKWLNDSLWEYSFLEDLHENDTYQADRSYKEEVLLHWLECGQGLIECPFNMEDPFAKDVIAKYYQEQKRKSELTSRRNAYDIAEAMIKDRLSIEIIAKYTGFLEEDIGKMKKHPGIFNDGCKKTSL